MSEYIDRQSLINHLNQSAAEYYSRAVERVIELEPAADVAPVVHGKWVDNGIPGSMLSMCSVCGIKHGACTFNYCPNCGADMQEVPNDD